MTCYYPLKGFKRLENGGLTFKKSESAGIAMEVACGQCFGCRLDKSRMWAMRCVHEASLYDDNCFITLTYDDEHVPWDGSLVKKHFVDFMKRLRRKIEPKKVRYYQCGEYGDEQGRPHYHALLFGLDFEDRELIGESNGEPLYTSPFLEKVWGHGFVTIGEVTFESAAYVARYCMKKVTGKRAEDHYLRCDEYGVGWWIEPEYSTMSRRPGIGRKWYEEFQTDVFPSDEVPVPGAGVYRGVPRYYEQIFESEFPDQHEEVKRLRKVYYFAHGESYTEERLRDREVVKKAQLAHCRRAL